MLTGKVVAILSIIFVYAFAVVFSVCDILFAIVAFAQSCSHQRYIQFLCVYFLIYAETCTPLCFSLLYSYGIYNEIDVEEC